MVAWAVLTIPEAVRFRAPGAASFDAAKPGRYVLWHEYRTVFENRTWNRDPKLPAGLRFRIVGPGGAELPLEKSAGSTFKDGASERVSVGTVEVREPGRHSVLVEGEMAPAVLSVSREFLWTLIASIVAALLMLTLGVGGGIALAVYGLARGLEPVPKVPVAQATPGAVFTAARPGVDAQESLRKLAVAVYALQAASFAFGVTVIAAVIINYLKRSEVAGTWLESHFTWQIRTFWWLLAWAAAGLATVVVLVGVPILLAAAIWFIYRIAKGWIALSERRPVG